MNQTKLKIIELIRYHFAFLCSKAFDTWKHRVIFYFLNCGTGSLGTTTYYCKNCDNTETVANACNSRNCPNCGALKRIVWAEKLGLKLLPVPHFHLVFTIPHQLNSLVYSNQSLLLDLLMKASGDTLLTFTKGRNKDAKPAFVQVLHTWTQTLRIHYHVHILMANGYFLDNKWVSPDTKFLFPIRAMSEVFKAKFLSGLEQLFIENRIKSDSKTDAKQLIQGLNLPKIWNTYCAPPYNGSSTAVKYFARYANRIGISDARITEATNDIVKFTWRKDKNEKDPIDPDERNKKKT